MDLDQSFLSELPLQHRQKVCRQIRQKQIEKYFEFEKSDRGRELLPRKHEKRNVHFSQTLTLQVAVDNFDDREVAKCLANGCDPNYATGNGTSVLHRCAAEDNVSAAELLISHGADVNILDDDWWTPLHTACSCDCPEIANLLVNNGADVAAIDVDGYFPVDQAPEGSEVKAVMTKHMENKGLTERVLHENRQLRPKEFLNYIKSLPLAIDINMLNKDGVSLLHIAAANGYRACMKALFRYNADVNRLDNYGWTPLHVAARFNQERSVILLLKQKANPNQQDLLGSKPSAVTSSDKIRGILMKCERKMKEKQAEEPVYLDLGGEDDEDARDNVYHEIDDSNVESPRDSQLVGIFRINSKTVRTKHVTISKEDELLEAKQMYEHIAEFSSGGADATATTTAGSAEKDDDKDDEGDYVSAAIWKSTSNEQGDLVPCTDNDNLVAVALVKDDTILTEIQRRYDAKQTYTLIGDVLVAVNPFQTLPCYAKDISLQYHTASSETKLPPHIYGIAEKSYKRLLYNKKSQCHVISGESGAGKSESCKYIIQHLLRVAGSEETNLNSKINQVNPLLEAFGNAVTVMNNNSSRFGKYVELNFTQQGKICGAKIFEYLLEKSRIVHQGKGEQNFHIFYWMMAGLSPEETSLYRLGKMNQFRYLRSSLPADQSASENKAKFWEVKECLKYIGFTSTDIQNVLQTLSIVLHLGEIEFHGVGNNEAAHVRNTDMLNTVSEMLDVSVEELRSALVADYTVTRGEQIKKERTVQQAMDCRDALAKALYARLFSWIVNGINQLIQPVYEHGEELQLGILDIFGFENFPHNSFEQICINVANEQIQQYTNDNIFQTEQEDCLLEGVPLVDLDYNNNQAILNVFFEKHTGLLAILDEESSFPKATDKSLATKLHQNTGKKHPGCYKTPRDGGLCFTVVHYAGSVMYDVTGMLEKNRDTLPNSILYTMKTSNRLLIKELFQSRITRTGSLAPSARQQRNSRRTMKKSSSPFEFFKKFKANNKEAKKLPKNASVEKKGPSTMAFHFRNSLSDLISKLQASSPHFVRCIKPNTTKSAFTFVPEYVLAQLRYTGISEIVKIRKFGYALRLPFHEFLNRFHVLVKCCLPSFCPMTDIQKCEEVVKCYSLQHVQFGKTKLFLKSEHVDKLDNLTADLERKVTTAQAVVRGFLGRQKSRKLSAVRDEERRQSAVVLRNKEVEKAVKTLSGLDEIISDYDDAFSVRRPTAAADDDDDDDDGLYDDAFSVQQHATGDGTGEEDIMNGHLQRGLPPTPTHGMHYDPSRPPPTPKEMYSQGMYASIEDQGYHDYKKQAPPPPRRDPGTRLSTSSVGTYEEIHVTESYSHHHQGHHQPQPHSYGNQSPIHSAHGSPAHHPGYHQQPQSYGNQSPVHMAHGSPAHQTGYYRQQSNENQPQRHTTHGSPVLKSKAGHEPQSPSSTGSRPFSYGAAILSPKLHHVTDQNVNQNIPSNTQNGHSQQNVPNLSNYQYSDQSASSPVMNYGKHESAFHPQSHRPPPCGPPPPVPPDHPSQGHRVAAPQPQYPQSPKMQRHSSIQGSVHKPKLPGSPKLTQKLSQRSKSLPCNPEDDLLPAPPPPLTVKENYIAAAQHTNRTPSPPLPPPPPELLTDLPPPSPPPPNTAMLRNVPHTMEPVVNQNLPNSAVSMSPRHQPAAPAAPPPPPPVSSIPKKRSDLPGGTSAQDGPRPRMGLPNENTGSYSPEPIRGQNLQSVAPPRIQKEASPDQAALIQQINKVQLKKTESLSHETEGERTSAGPKTGVVELSGVKLRQTSARLKLLEKDGVKTASEEPVLDPVPVPQEEAPPPPAVSQPPPAEPQQQTQVTPAVSMFEKKVELIAKGDQRMRRKGDTSNDSTMDISIDNIDVNEVPGYTPITRSTPVWKREMIEKKNQEKIQDYIDEKRREKEEAEKWKNVPAWKRKLMMEKQKEQSQKSKEDQEKAAEEEANRKRRAKQAEEERKAKIREQQEMEKRMEEELQDVPEWKREIMMKRGGAIKNWADEREDKNEQELEEQRQAEMERENASSPPPAQTQPKKASANKSAAVLHERQDAPSTPPSQPKSNKASKKTSVVLQETRDEPAQPPSQPQPKKVSPQKTIVLQNQTKEPEVKKPPPPRRSLDENKLEEEWDSLPLWKREIMMKRGGAPTNWGDEREEVNEADEDECVEQ